MNQQHRMGIKRARNSKRIPLSSDDIDGDTFVNNSDYASGSQSEVSAHQIPPTDPNEDNPFLENSDINKELDRSRTSSPKSTAEKSISNLEIPPLPAVNQPQPQDKLDEPDEPSLVEQNDIDNTLKSESPASEPATEPSEPAETSHVKLELPPFPDLKSPLSFSQQQSEILQQSPLKRRELTLPIHKNEPRLVINKLVLTNFKSYAGSQTIGPFNSSFSAVVGPNGSGKSNVIDSLLFVFGFRASKMRQGKLSELIHNSSGGEKLDYCQVDIHFHHVLDNVDDATKAEVLPDSSLVISRKATKSNQSLYYINQQPSNYTEVTRYLKDKGIDLDHKRFLILQGEVELIAQMKAKAERENDDGLLEYLEDIIGTSKYKQLIEDSLSKIDELNEVCVEKENRFELVEKDKDLLEEKKNEALKFLEFEKKLINKQSIQYQVSIQENQQLIEENEKVVNKLNEELAEEQAKNSQLTEAIEVYLKEQEAAKNAITKINGQISQISKKQKETNKLQVTLEEKSKNLDNKVKKIKKTKESLELNLSSAKSKLKMSNDASQQFKTEMEELNVQLETEKAKLDEIRKSLNAKTSGFTAKIQKLQSQLQPWNDKLKQNGNALTLAKSELEMLQSQKEGVTKQLEEAKERLANIKKEGKQKESEYMEAQEKLSQIEEQISLGQEQCAYEKEQLELKRSQVSAMRQKTQDAVNSLNNYQNKNKVLASLMRLAKSGRIEGFYGRLGDLGVIDDVYDIAISTACPGLDSMVVETVETAQTCIDYLRKNKLGYANFICLNKLRQFNLSPIKTPGNPATIKRLFDLIRPQNPKFAAAFYSKVYNTLVAPDLKEAKSVAYGAKRWKVVTLDGKVVDTSGTMSGGGNYFAKGGMRLSNSTNEDAMDISPDDVDQMQQDLRDQEAKFEAMEKEYLEKESMLKKLELLKPDTEFLTSRLRLDIESLSTEKREVLLRCKSLIAENANNNATKQFDEDIQQKEQEIEAYEAERVNLKLQMSESESQIKALEEKIMDAGGVELKVQNSKVDSIKQKMEIITEKTSSDRMAIRKLENDIKRHTKTIEQTIQELETSEQDLVSIQLQLQETNEKLGVLQGELKALEEQRNDHESKLEQIHGQIEDQNEQINKFKSLEIEIQNKLEKHNSIISKASRYIEHDKENLESLVIRDTTEYISWMDEEEQKKYNGTIIEEIDEEKMANIDIEEVNSEIEMLKNVLDNIKVDIEVLKEYGVKKSEYETRRTDLNSAVGERDEIKNYCEELKRKRLDEFMEGFNVISMTLKDMYRMITMGGNAELELVDSLDPFSEGILFSVMPPKKSWKNISNLSGGEKTLSSLALVFALHQYKPTPLYVMDEIDAALDFRNVSIVANYIKERTKNAQFIVISLRNNMFELAQQLVGIYKVNNKTKSISLQNRDFLNV